MGTEGRKTDKLHKSWRDRLRNDRGYVNNNNGYSIIELIIVLAIIAIIISTVFYSIILVFSAFNISLFIKYKNSVTISANP